MSYEKACRIICATHDRDAESARKVLGPMTRTDLTSLVLMLSAMVSPDAHAPAAVLEARGRHMAMTSDLALDEPGSTFAVAADLVASLFRIDLGALFGHTREVRATQARQVLCWLGRNVEGMSYPEIGRVVQRNHATVMHAVERVNRSPELRAKAALVADQMRGAAA